MDVSITWLRVVGPFPVSPRESRGGGFPPRRQSRPPPPVRGLAPLRIPPTASTSSHAGRGVEEAPAGGSPGLNEGYPIRYAQKPIRWKHARQNAHTARRGRPQNRPVPTAPTRRGATEHRQQHRQPEATPTSRKKLMATREPKPKTEAPQATTANLEKLKRIREQFAVSEGKNPTLTRKKPPTSVHATIAQKQKAIRQIKSPGNPDPSSGESPDLDAAPTTPWLPNYAG